MDLHPYGWLSLVPSLVAIALAIATRHVVLSMLAGIFAGALITHGGQPIAAVVDTLELHLWKSLANEDRLRVYTFTIFMGAMIGVIQQAGGMRGLVEVVSPWARNRRRGQIATWVLGLLVFFDDYANTVLLGNTLQPLCDKLRISREKLAYVVDSTAAPVAGLAVISTWVAGEIEFVQAGLDSLSDAGDASAFNLFLQSIPYRFYVLWALAFVFLIGFLQRDFGPMLRAERRTLQSKTNSVATDTVDVPIGKWWNAVVPIVVTVAAVLFLIICTGRAALHDEPAVNSPSLWQVFGKADSYVSLLWGSFAGLIVAIGMAWSQRILSWAQVNEAVARGAKLMIPALAVLWLASALSSMTGNGIIDGAATTEDASYPAKSYRLYTGEYLAGMISADTDGSASDVIAAWLPTIVFVAAAGISFSTGTSWGTMAILLPITIPLVYAAIGQDGNANWQNDPIMICAVGSVLAGSIFGDHCSPISDTTVLSSQSCGCDHSAHVWTQLPYAVTVGVISILCGTIPIGFGISVWVTLPVGLVALIAIVCLVGRVPNDKSEEIP